jgi:hypothetical protein
MCPIPRRLKVLSDDVIRREFREASSQLTTLMDVDVEGVLGNVHRLAVRRQRTRSTVLAIAALAFVVALMASDRLGRLLVGMDRELPPARQELDVDREDDRSIDVRRTLQVPHRETGSHGIGGGDVSTGGRDSGGVQIDDDAPASDPDKAPGAIDDRTTDTTVPMPRTYSDRQPYDYHESVTDSTACWGASVCTHRVKFVADERYRFVSIEIYDSQARPVLAALYVDRNGDGRASDEKPTEFCTHLTHPVRIPAEAVVEVIVKSATCADDFQDPKPTRGVIEATFRTARSG